MQGSITIEETTYEEVYRYFPKKRKNEFGSLLYKWFFRIAGSLFLGLIIATGVEAISTVPIEWLAWIGSGVALSVFIYMIKMGSKEKHIYTTIYADKFTIQSDYFIYDPGNFDKLPSLFIYNTHNNEETFFHLYGLYFSDMVEDGRLPNTEFTLYYDREPEVLIGIHCSGASCAPAYIFPDTPEYNSDLFYTDRNFIPKDILIGMLKKEL